MIPHGKRIVVEAEGSMAIRLYFSNNLGSLAERLAEELREERRQRDPFVASSIIVPNPNLKKWLQLRLAEGAGVAINLEFPFLEKGLWEVLCSLEGSISSQVELLTQQRLHLLLASRLLQEDPEHPGLAPLRSYLLTSEGQTRPDTVRRAWQLAGRLAMYFLEYAYQRQEMIEAWRRGELSRDAARSHAANVEMEACQRSLYLEVLGPDGLRDRWAAKQGRRPVTLPELAELTLGRQQRTRTREPRPLHFFGLSQISPFHRDLLLRLSASHTLHIYQMNVCAEFWEDVTSDHEDRWLRRQRIGSAEIIETAEGLELEADPLENPILKWWGKPGRENQRLLSELEERSSGHTPFESFWLATSPVPSPEPTVLEWVQYQVLRRSSERPDPPPPQDTSLQVIGAPGIFREVETVYHSILGNMREDPDLLLTEIAVLVPNMTSYRPVIDSVFSAAEHPIPFNLSDANAADESVYGRSVLALLELAAGSFTRREVFELVLNPCFLAAARLTRQEALVWVKWVDALNVFHSLDAADKKARGYGDSVLYTWQQALIRLRLGRIMEPPPRKSMGPTPDYQHYIPYADLESRDTETLGTFCSVLETLFAGLRGLTKARLPAEEWRERLQAILTSHLQPPAELPAERQIQSALQEGLMQLDEFAALRELQGGPRREEVDLALVAELIRGVLTAIPSRHGSYLSGGVNISSLRPMRPIPFKIVYVLGLGEGEFPGMAQQSTLDLRRRYRRIGDVSTPEENRYLFLETMVSTRHKLYLMYVDREVSKDQLFHPCSVVNQLCSYVKEAVTGRRFELLHMPLQSHSEKYLLPSPVDSSDAWVNFSRQARLVCLADKVARSRSAPTAAVELLPDPLVELKAPAMVERQVRPQVHIGELTRLLRNPLEAALRRHLNLYDDDECDPLVDCDEPFYTRFPGNVQLVTDVLYQAMADNQRETAGIAEIGLRLLHQSYDAYRRRGRTPDGAFAEHDRRQAADRLSDRLAGGGDIAAESSLHQFAGDRRVATCYPLIALGACAGEDAPDLVLPAARFDIEIAGCTHEVELHGEQRLCWHHAGDESYHVLTINDANKPAREAIDKSLLGPFLFCLAARLVAPKAGADWLAEKAFTIHVAHRKGITSTTYRCSVEQAEAYLRRLLTDLLDPRRFDLLPLEIINQASSKPYLPECTVSRKEYADELAKLCLEADDGSFGWTPPELVALLDAEVPDDAQELVRERFTPIYGDK